MSIDKVLEEFLDEDVGHGDITTQALVDPGQLAVGRVVCKQRAIIAGIAEAIRLLKLVDCDGQSKLEDGQEVQPGTVVLEVRGPGSELLKVERTLLNLLSHMSGVATATAELVQIAKRNGSSARIACTRKTLPGLRYFEKRAVELGGGDTHRLRLDDAVLIKDNHLELTGSITDAVKKAKSRVSFTKKVEVEATTPDQAVEAATAGADIILLDNMASQQVKRSLSLLERKQIRGHILIEVSGGVTKENLAGYAIEGVDVISVGSITNSAKAIDMSLNLRSQKR